MDDAILIADLSGSTHLPKVALRMALERPEVVAPETLRLLEVAATGADLEEAEANLLFWGLHVLAHARDTRALAPLLRLLRQDEDTLDAYLGDAVTWGEALTLLEQAAGDPSTAFGAELAGWAYPASMPTLLGLTAQIGNRQASNSVMPWALARPQRASDEEITSAVAQLEDGIVFTD